VFEAWCGRTILTPGYDVGLSASNYLKSLSLTNGPGCSFGADPMLRAHVVRLSQIMRAAAVPFCVCRARSVGFFRVLPTVCPAAEIR